MWQPPPPKKESKRFLVWYLSLFLTESLLGQESKSTNSWYSPLISQRRSVLGFVEYMTVHSSGGVGGGASHLYPSWTLVLQISNCVQRGEECLSLPRQTVGRNSGTVKYSCAISNQSLGQNRPCSLWAGWKGKTWEVRKQYCNLEVTKAWW